MIYFVSTVSRLLTAVIIGEQQSLQAPVTTNHLPTRYRQNRHSADGINIAPFAILTSSFEVIETTCAEVQVFNANTVDVADES